MKNNITLYLTIISVFLFNCFAQKKQVSPADKKIKNKLITTEALSKNKFNSIKTIKLYQVEERINMQFGGYTTTYTVSDKSLISTNDLGPNNTRVITPIFAKIRQIDNISAKTITEVIKPSPIIDTVQHVVKQVNLAVTDSLDHQGEPIYIVMIKTYERVAEKGYKSVEMFQKLGNAFYFNSEMGKAAKWYEKLFAMTTNLDPEYYYRYAQSLKAIDKNDKANELLEKFNQLTGNKTR